MFLKSIVKFLLLFSILIFSTQVNGQIFSKTFEAFTNPSKDTTSWKSITLKKLNCSIEMPGQPVFEYEETENYFSEESTKTYTVSYESNIIENLTFTLNVSENMDPIIHSDSMDNKMLQAYYEDNISNTIGFFSEEELEFEQLTIDGYPALASQTRFFDMIDVTAAVILIKNRMYHLSVYSEEDQEILSKYFFHSLKFMKK